jgi:hypothetical protein
VKRENPEYVGNAVCTEHRANAPSPFVQHSFVYIREAHFSHDKIFFVRNPYIQACRCCCGLNSWRMHISLITMIAFSIINLALTAATLANALTTGSPYTQRLVLRDPQVPTIEQVCADHPGSPCTTNEDCYGQPAVCHIFGRS